MHRKLIIFSLIVILFSSLAYADLADVTYTEYSYDNANISGTTVLDFTPNNYHGVNDGSTTGATGILNEAFNLDGINHFISMNRTNDFSGSGFSFFTWVNADDITNLKVIYSNGWNGGTASGLIMHFQSGNLYLNAEDGALNINTNSEISTSNWLFVGFTYNNTDDEFYVYVNGKSKINGTLEYDTIDGSRNDFIGRNFNNAGSGVNYFDGKIDESYLFNRELTLTEVQFLYNNGAPTTAQRYPFPVEAGVNGSLENGFGRQQITNVTLSNNVFSTIISDTFNCSCENATSYITSTAYFTTTANNEVECQVTLNGNAYGSTITRSLTPDTIGSIYLSTTVEDNLLGENTVTLECRRSSGSGTITVYDSNGQGHILVNENNETMNANSSSYSGAVSSTRTLIQTVKLTTTDTDLSSDEQNRSLVIDYKGQYTYTTDGEISTFVRLVNNATGKILNTCPIYMRDGNSGTTGIIGVNCFTTNIPHDIIVDVLLYGESTGTGSISGNLIVKEFIHHPSEAGKINLTNIVASSNTFVSVANLTSDNTDHDSSDLFVFTGIPIYTESTSDVLTKIRFDLVNGGTTSSEAFEYIVTNETKNLIAQTRFINLTLDTYTINLMVEVNDSNVTFESGELVTYFQNNKEVNVSESTITVFDSFNNLQINEFSVKIIDNTTFTTSNGQLTILSFNEIENLTIFSDGYFNKTLLNVNLTENSTINTTLELIKNRYIFEENFRTFAGNSTILNYEIDVIGLNNSFTGNFSTSTGNLTLFLPRDYENGTIFQYNITVKPSGFEFYNTIINVTNTSVIYFNQTVLFFGFNSLNINILNEITTSKLNATNTSLQFISSQKSFNTSTTSGDIFVNLLSPVDYELRYEPEGYSPRSYFFTVENGSTQTINIYALNESNPEYAQKIVFVSDQSDNRVENAIIQMQREYVLNDNTTQFITVEMGKTDSDGKTDFYVQENSNVKYRFLVLINDILVSTSGETNFIGEIDDQTTLDIITGILVEDFENNLRIASTTDFNNVTNVFSSNYIDTKNSISSGQFSLYQVDLDTNEKTLINYSLFNTTSASVNFPITPTNDTRFEMLTEVCNAAGICQAVSGLSKTFVSPTWTEGPDGLVITVAIVFFTTLACAFLPLWIGAVASFTSVIVLIEFFE